MPGFEKTGLSKKARFEPESPIFNIKVPSTIEAKSNGRMGFAPLFEEGRQKNVEKLFEMLRPVEQKPTHSFGQNNFEANVRSSGRSGLKGSDLGTSDLSSILGLPELPFEAPQRPATMSLMTFDDDDVVDDGGNEIDYDEYNEDGKLQLLPKKSAGKSVARFHKDREQPEVRLVPPPPVSAAAAQPLQVVGHVLDEEDLKFVPNSPIFNISHTSGARMLTIPARNSNKNDRNSNKVDAGRSGKSGDQALGLPLHLVPPSIFNCSLVILQQL